MKSFLAIAAVLCLSSFAVACGGGDGLGLRQRSNVQTSSVRTTVQTTTVQTSSASTRSTRLHVLSGVRIRGILGGCGR